MSDKQPVSLSSRRRLLLGATGAAVSYVLMSRGQAAQRDSNNNVSTSIRIGSPHAVPNNFGDTWITAWADDGRLYSPANDTLGFGIPQFFTRDQVKLFQSDLHSFAKGLTREQMQEFQYGPIQFTRIEGSDPLSLSGATINRMPSFEIQDGYRALFEGSSHLTSPDGRAWKSSGCTFVDGTLYWVIARQKYPDNVDDVGLRQTAVNASLIKSVDYGKTWSRTAKENLEAPMFPGSAFATPYFIDYGPNRPRVDGADEFIYAISNNGFWDNGDSLILARVRRDRIGRLAATDWQFHAGGDGVREASWTREVGQAKPLVSRPGKLGETGATYLHHQGRYSMIGWYYPSGSGYVKGASPITVWDFYEAPKPWGPWTHVHAHTWDPEGYYCPSVCARWQSASRVYAFTAGDFNNWWEYYRLTVVPIDFS